MPIIKKKARKAEVPSRGKRRSARLALDVSGAEKDESSDDEAMDVSQSVNVKLNGVLITISSRPQQW